MSADPIGKMKCDTCGKDLRFKIANEGKVVACPDCKATLRLRSTTSQTLISRPVAQTVAAKKFEPTVIHSQQIPPLTQGSSPHATVHVIHSIAPQTTSQMEFSQKRVTAGLFALFLFGPMGSHKFYLGLNQAGAVMAVVTCISVMGACLFFPLIGLLITASIASIEGIVYLTKSDEQFYQDYVVNKRQWF